MSKIARWTEARRQRLLFVSKPETPVISMRHLSSHHGERLDIFNHPGVHRLLESVIGVALEWLTR